MRKIRRGERGREPLPRLRGRRADTTGTTLDPGIPLSHFPAYDRRWWKECIPYRLRPLRAPRRLRLQDASTGYTQPEPAWRGKKVHGLEPEFSDHNRPRPRHSGDETKHREMPGSFPAT